MQFPDQPKPTPTKLNKKPIRVTIANLPAAQKPSPLKQQFQQPEWSNRPSQSTPLKNKLSPNGGTPHPRFVVGQVNQLRSRNVESFRDRIQQVEDLENQVQGLHLKSTKTPKKESKDEIIKRLQKENEKLVNQVAYLEELLLKKDIL